MCRPNQIPSWVFFVDCNPRNPSRHSACARVYAPYTSGCIDEINYSLAVLIKYNKGNPLTESFNQHWDKTSTRLWYHLKMLQEVRVPRVLLSEIRVRKLSRHDVVKKGEEAAVHFGVIFLAGAWNNKMSEERQKKSEKITFRAPQRVPAPGSGGWLVGGRLGLSGRCRSWSTQAPPAGDAHHVHRWTHRFLGRRITSSLERTNLAWCLHLALACMNIHTHNRRHTTA